MPCILKQLIEKAIKFNKLLFLYFVFKQAFDRVHLEDILKAMQGHNICEKYMKIIVEMNNNIIRMKAENILTEDMPKITSI
jgi:hypothetical protein